MIRLYPLHRNLLKNQNYSNDRTSILPAYRKQAKGDTHVDADVSPLQTYLKYHNPL